MNDNDSPTGLSDLGNTQDSPDVSTPEEDGREKRGRALARTGKIESLGKVWLVSSQTNSARYVVNLDAKTCTCPDHESRGVKCKHQFAVEFTVKQETFAFIDERGTVETTTTKTVRVTYKQDWPRYNAAQVAEKATVQELLRGLCDGVVTPPHPGRGPKPIPLSDVLYGMTMKVYTTMSGRRASTDIRECESKGFIERAPHYNSIFNYFEKPEMAPLLTALVEDSASPLASVEQKFAIDSTGFSTSVYRRWFDHKYGREMKEQRWIKAHAMVGTKTNVITAIRVTDESGGDSPQLPALLTTTTRHFKLGEVSADKAYLSHDNLALIEQAGAVPYIPFKSNSQGDGSAAWRRMWGLFTYKQAEFLTHYHARSNVESTFSAVKRLFGSAVRSKRLTAQVNEVLCKALAYNLTVLAHAIHELGVEPAFASTGAACSI